MLVLMLLVMFHILYIINYFKWGNVCKSFPFLVNLVTASMH